MMPTEVNNAVYYNQWWWDEQYTPAYWVEILLPYISHLKDKIIWCPFDKYDSQFVIVLRKNWYTVVNSHIEYGQDFFDYEPENRDIIISNPPYKKKRTYRERCLDFKKPFTLLLPLNILSDSVINVTMKQRERESYSYLSHHKEWGSIIIQPDKPEIPQLSKQPTLV